MVIDLTRMHAVVVNHEIGVAGVEGGARWADSIVRLSSLVWWVSETGRAAWRCCVSNGRPAGASQRVA
jgi:hypothetical protein